MEMLRFLLALFFFANVHGDMNFMVIGDWGGQTHSPYTTAGERAAAVGMGKIAATLKSSFVLALGDNFYSNGISGDSHSHRFLDTFEKVYTASSLQTPWYVLAGNHDHYGNVTAQIQYTQHSKRWTFPSEWYTFTKSFVDGSKTVHVQFVFFDTVIACGSSYHDEERNIFVKPEGPMNVESASQQWKWLESELAKSTADYLWVGGHYPVWSVCEHGPTHHLVSTLKPLLEKYHVTGYMSGHDHCQEFLDEGKGPVYVLTGTGDGCCYSATNMDKVPSGSLKFSTTHHNKGDTIGGFASINVRASEAIVTFYKQDGRVQWTSPAIKPRH